MMFWFEVNDGVAVWMASLFSRLSVSCFKWFSTGPYGLPPKSAKPDQAGHTNTRNPGKIISVYLQTIIKTSKRNSLDACTTSLQRPKIPSHGHGEKIRKRGDIWLEREGEPDDCWHGSSVWYIPSLYPFLPLSLPLSPRRLLRGLRGPCRRQCMVW